MRAGQARDRFAAGERTRKRQQPDAHRRERDQLEQGERDEARGEDDHARREEPDAQRRGPPEPPAAARKREGADDDREEGQTQTARDDVVHHRAHRDRHEAHCHQVEPRRNDRATECAPRAATGLEGKRDCEEDPVRRQEEPREHHGRVECAAGEVGERSQLGEVVVPPQRILRGESRDDHARGQRQHRQSAGTVCDGVVRGCGARPRGPR